VPEKFQFSSKEKVIGVVTLAALLLSILIDDALTVYLCLSVVLIVTWIACYIHEGKRIHRAGVAAVLTTVILGAGCRFHFVNMKKEQEDVANHLGFKADIKSQNDIRSTVITLRNGSKTNIKYNFSCPIKLLVADSGQTVIDQGIFRNHLRSGTLEAGTGAQYDDCLSALSAPTQVLDCVDIQVQVHYALETQPAKDLLKEHGFVLRKIGDKVEWEDRDAYQEVSDCQKSIRLRRPPSWELFNQKIATIRANNAKMLATIGGNLSRKSAVLLSEAIFDFANERKTTFPKEANEMSEGPGMMETIEKVKNWDRETDYLFKAKYQKLLDSSFKEMEKAHIDTGPTKTWCNPPPLSRTVDVMRHCAYGIGLLAGGLPN